LFEEGGLACMVQAEDEDVYLCFGEEVLEKAC
jgi:hypothetical protein